MSARTALAIIFGACCLSLFYGPDNNWDLRNYHLYNPFALLDGRLSRDLFAAGTQTYFNPLIDVPYYLLSVHLTPGFPRLVAFLSGVPFGVLSVVVLRIARLSLPNDDRGWLAAVATATGMTGTVTLSEIGTTFGDIQVAILVLGGLIPPLTLLSSETADPARWTRALIVAGFLAGVAAGLKPVACIFAPGAALALAFAAGGARRFLVTGLVFTAAWIAGFGLVFAPWGLTTYRMFGDPVFPLFNQIFKSSWFPAAGGEDTRFLPRTVWQMLFYPFFWLRGEPFVVAEFSVRDPRFALAYIAILVLTIRRRRIGKATLALCIFSVISYIAWQTIFSILRYAVALEALTGILIARAALSLINGKISPPRAIAVVTVALITIFAVSSRPGWGRLRSFGERVFDVEAPTIPDRASVVFLTTPATFVAPFLHGNDLIFMGLTDVPVPSRLAREIAARIASRPAVMAVVGGSSTGNDSLTPPFGFRVLTETCVPIHSANQRDLRLCEGRPR